MDGPLFDQLGNGLPADAMTVLADLRARFERQPFTTTQAAACVAQNRHGVLNALAGAAYLEKFQDGRGQLPAIWQLTPKGIDPHAFRVLPTVDQLAA